MGADPRGWNVRSISELDRSTSPPDRRPRRTPDRGRPAGRGLRRDRRAEHHLRPLRDPRPADRGPEPGTLPADGLPRRGRGAVRPGGGARRGPRGLRRPDPADQRARPRDRRLRAVRARCRVPLEDRRAGLRDQRHGLARSRTSIRRRPERRRSSPRSTAPGRTGSRAGTAAPRSAWPATTTTGATRPCNERLIVRWYDNPGQRFAELQDATVDGIDDVFPSSVAAVTDDVGLAAPDAARAERLLPRLHQHVRPVRRRAGPPGDRDGHRPPAHRRRLLPARLGAGHPLRAVCHPARLHRRPVVRVRPDPGQGDACGGRLSGRVRHEDPVQRGGAAVPARSDRRRHRAQDPAAGQSRHPRRARGPCPRTPSWPTPPRASSTASTCSARA